MTDNPEDVTVVPSMDSDEQPHEQQHEQHEQPSPSSHTDKRYTDDDETENENAPLRPVAASSKYSHKSRLFHALLTAIAIAFAVLVALVLKHTFTSGTHHNSQYITSAASDKYTPKTQTKQQKAITYQLNFQALYPDITSPAGSNCRKAWDILQSIPCHEKLFDRGDDDGKMRIMGSDPMYFIPKICDPRCEISLQMAHERLSATCTSSDIFILEGYKGIFNTTLLEAGPTSAIETLLHRKRHVCRKSPTDDSDYEYCPIEMWERFDVTDGMNVNLQSINDFIHKTDKKRREPARRVRTTRGTNKYKYTTDFPVRAQQYGPGAGETSCNWCVFNFLNHTLRGWKEGAIISPESRLPVSLPEFIRRAQKAGNRCAPTDTWEKINNEAIAAYIDLGLLEAPGDPSISPDSPIHETPDDWRKSQPSGDLHYLILNGPSEGDSPVSDILFELKHLESDEIVSSYSPKTIRNSKACLSGLVKYYTSQKCYWDVPEALLTKMLEENPKSEHSLRSSYCGEGCSVAASKWHPAECKYGLKTKETQAFLMKQVDAEKVRERYCSLVTGKSGYDDCGKALISMGKQDWAFEGRPETSDLIPSIDEALESLKSKVSEMEPMERTRAVGASICANCFWDWVVGNNLDMAVHYMFKAAPLSEYVEFLERYHSTCYSLGARWLGGTPYGDDPLIWRVKTFSGHIMRHIDAEKTSWDPERVYGVNEATGKVSWNRDITVGKVTMWHVLLAERKLKAILEERVIEWEREEKEYRRKADAKIWRQESLVTTYIGPKDGFAEKQEAQEAEEPKIVIQEPGDQHVLQD